MKFLTISLALLVGASHVAFAADSNCQESAIQYVVDIVSAPYKNDPKFEFDKKNLKAVVDSVEGDGAEVYENITVQHTIDEGESYSLKLYVQEIGGVCPLVKFQLN